MKTVGQILARIYRDTNLREISTVYCYSKFYDSKQFFRNPFDMEVAASIAGLISLADVTFRVVYKYVRGVKEAESDIRNLKREIEGLSSVLRTLHALADVLVTEGESNKTALSVGVLDQCKETLEEIRVKVQGAFASFEENRFLRATLQKLKWPFSDKETKELLSKLSRHKLTISMATSADSLSKLHILLNQQAEHNGKIEEAVKNIDEKTKLIANIQLDKEKRRILNVFMDPTLNPRHNLDQSIKLRQPTTGTWLMSSVELQSWFNDPGSLLWLNGIAGGGKTILAGLVIQEAMSRSSHEIGVAFFFCDYKNTATLRPAKILGAIAAQLALQNDTSFDILEKYHEDLNPSDALAVMPDVEGLGITISSMIKTFRQVLIVVDGLDECGDEMGSVTTSLAAFASLDTPASVALFSRQETDIRARMGDVFTDVSIEAHNEDIEIYVWSELDKRIESQRLRLSDPNTAHDIAEQLIMKAHGMFRWVACQLDSLCDLFTDRDRLDALKQLPQTLHDSYRRLLERVNTKPLRTQKRVQLCLHFIAFFPGQLTISELCQAVSTPDDIGDNLDGGNIVNENDIIHYCSSLIRKSAEGNTFEFAHFSVQEFLESDMTGLEKYRVSRQESSSLLALQCLRFVQLGNIDVWPEDRASFLEEQMELVNELPFYQQAAAYWPMLVRTSLEKSKQPLLQEAMESLFCDSHSPKLRSWIFWFMVALCDTKRTFCPIFNYRHATDIALDEEIEPLHFAAALNMPDLCLRLIEDGADPTQTCRLGPPLLLAESLLLDALGMDAEMFPVDSDLFLLLLPTVKQRNSTLKCLKKEATLTDISGYPSLLSITMIVSCHLQDFTPLIELLSNGITPTTTDIDLFESYLTRWWSQRGYRLSLGRPCEKKILSNLEASLRALNRHLRDTCAFDHEWGFEFGKVLWTRAIAMEMSFTRDPSLTHQEISISTETLRERIMLAISNDSPSALSRHLNDRRVSSSDSWPWNNSPSQTLLHHATSLNALQCVELLLSKECDPYAINDDGVPVLHTIDITKNGSIIDVFLAHQVSLLGTDKYRRTLWHICARQADSSADFMLKLFSAKPEDTQQAVLMKADDGHTPLTLALSNKFDPGLEHEVTEDNALSFIKHCNDISGFWRKHDPVLPLAFDFGSDKVIHRLLDLGIRSEPLHASTPTPLHKLDATVQTAWVDLIMTAFPGVVESRYSDRLPIENYAVTCIKEGLLPNREVFEKLASDTVLQSQDQNGSTPWAYFCSSIFRNRMWEWGSDISRHDAATIATWEYYIDLGAVRAYDEVSGECGIGKLLSAFLDSVEHGSHSSLLNLLESHVLDKAIVSSRSWNPLARDVVLFFQDAVENANINIVDILLKHGIDIHQRVDGNSAIEVACNGSLATYLCKSQAGRDVLNSLLNYSDHQKLAEFSINKRGDGLLHRIAFEGEEPHIRWLMKELVDRGVDINGIDYEADPEFRCTPLVRHIICDSLYYAGFLLELGADPAAYANGYEDGNLSHGDAISCAAYYGRLSFLQKLLALTQSTAAEFPYLPLRRWYFDFGRRKLHIECNSLHIACYAGHYDIVVFFVENNLFAYDITASKGIKPLHLAALGGHPRIIDYLIEKGQDVDVMDDKRVTPLHFAALNGHLKATETLLNKNAKGSFSTLSWTPRIAASGMGHKSIVELLDNAIGFHDDTKCETIKALRHRQELLDEMREAIHSDDLPKCRVLASDAFPLNDSRSDGYTPLLEALEELNLPMIETLLEVGASVLTRCYFDARQRCSLIEYAALNDKGGKILRKLVDQYARQGGDLIEGPDSPLFFAAKGNLGGIRILLDYFRKHSKEWGDRQDDVNKKVLERRRSFNDIDKSGSDEFTALHVAVICDQPRIAQLLLENGADVDSLSSYGAHPLQRSKSSEMTSLLIRFGASIVPVLTLSFGEVMHRWADVVHEKAETFESISWKEDAIHIPQGAELWLGLDMFPRDVLPDWRQLLAIRHLQGPLREYIRSFSRLRNYLLSFSDGYCFLLNGDFQLENLEPFPWYQICADGFIDILFLRSKFRLFQRRISRPVFKHWLNLEPGRGWSPLCRAASMDYLDAMENCLSIGADIDFEGCSWGSALMIASACGRLASVKLLVRSGAKTHYVGRKGYTDVFSVTQSKLVKQWLLVGRFVEQKKIATSNEGDTNYQLGQTGRRSGTAKIKVRLAELYRRRWHESSLDYLRRLELLKLELRGKVPYYTDGVIYGDES
ncbi:hypothetical protein FPOA_03863 [Fusarium poae]|uniref:NACHT domain-containing protein n=1 Tax=Fusarium poae TaxID=36050 RepID=A0A1B8ASI6_FUSPO|nr:hypothetical protein FPOA_03863 [Fusarium poae]